MIEGSKDKSQKVAANTVQDEGDEVVNEAVITWDGTGQSLDAVINHQMIDSSTTSLYSSEAVNCSFCKTGKEKPCQNTTSLREGLHLFNQFIDASDKIPVDEIFSLGLDTINTFVQYYSTYALTRIIPLSSTKQIDVLKSKGLLENLKTVLCCSFLFILQEATELCSKMALKSPSLRDDVVICGSLRIGEFVSGRFNSLPVEFSQTVATHFKYLCHHKPIPEYISITITSYIRSLLLHEVC
ncbi:unnamed protein product [Thelazia callipaeda]|uniref:Cyclin N-terminal domain-containing protein n=1 Tax=Thelazia callipaeda TaxID=103827 RepID=A0A0N5CQ60_THECL|nr:unnamed protein product [Thelazia callipaeda]